MPSTRLYGPSGAPGTAGLVAQNTPGAAAAVLPALQTVLGTTETVILNPALQSATQALVLSIPPNSPLEQRQFEIQANGYLNQGVSTTVTIKLYSGTSTTVGSDTLLGSSGAITAFTGKTSWLLKALCSYDSVSGKLQGTIKFIINNTLVAEAALSNVITGLTNAGPGAGAPVANFVLSVTFGSAGTNVINVQDFCISF